TSLQTLSASSKCGDLMEEKEDEAQIVRKNAGDGKPRAGHGGHVEEGQESCDDGKEEETTENAEGEGKTHYSEINQEVEKSGELPDCLMLMICAHAIGSSIIGSLILICALCHA
ncbi:hypothetical protein ACJX0J_038388, partial [Zea mays]